MSVTHIKRSGNSIVRQSIREHSEKTAEYAADNLRPTELDELGRLVGLIHDMGKCTRLFEDYIERAFNGEKVVRGSVNHTFAGVVYLLERYHKGDCTGYRELTCELAAYAVGAHHGHFDCVSEFGSDGFHHRLDKDRKEICYEEAKHTFFLECICESEIDKLFGRAEKQVRDFMKKVTDCSGRDGKMRDFYIGMTARLVLSALIDADRRDTSEFMSGRLENKNEMPSWSDELAYTEKKLNCFSADSDIKKARREFSEHCREAAERPSGIYRLNMPTGAGKTLSSLRFAQAHALSNSKRHIYYIIPLLSVIEQNAEVWRNNINNSANKVLEHHSEVIGCSDDGDIDEYETLTESWRSPYVITTLVQFLNTLFSGKTSAVRRMNQLAESVIIIDEVQSVPLKLLYCFNLALNFISVCCNATIVLCSATQPCFDKVKYAIGFASNAELVPYEAKLVGAFIRTEIEYSDKLGGYTDNEIAEFVSNRLLIDRTVLLICNTKTTSVNVYSSLSHNLPEDTLLFYLSTSLCMKHRINTFNRIKDALKIGRRVICVSTQLVEAGVDVSFGCVIRAVAGLDNVAQSAGRCNRNGELGNRLGKVFIIKCREEKLSRLPDIALSETAFYEFLNRYNADNAKFGGYMLSEASISLYYNRFWTLPDISNQFTYPLPEVNASLFSLISSNREFLGGNEALTRHYALHQAFKTAGEKYSVFDSNTRDVVVPYNSEAEELINIIASADLKYDRDLIEDTVRQLKPYTVSLYEDKLRTLSKNGGLVNYADGHIFSLMPNFYDREALGVVTETVKCIIN